MPIYKLIRIISFAVGIQNRIKNKRKRHSYDFIPSIAPRTKMLFLLDKPSLRLCNSVAKKRQ